MQISRLLPGCQPIQEFESSEDWDALVITQVQKMTIIADHEVGLFIQGASQHRFIYGVIRDITGET